MQLHIWTSEFLKNHGNGTIAVMAEGTQEARAKVLGDFNHLIDQLFPHLDRSDPEDAPEIDQMRRLLLKDLEATPKTQDRFYVRGSD